MTPGPWNDASLRAEADYFHRALFGFPVPALVADRYIQLHTICFPSPNPRQRETTEEIVRLSLDVEAVEYAFRLHRRKHLLTAKLQALLYLAEVRREYYPLFFNESPAPIKGKLKLLQAVARSAGKLLKGIFLVRSHGLD